MSKTLFTNEWQEIEFNNELWKTFVALSEEQNKQIPYACNKWYCMACACKIKKWKESINKTLKWEIKMKLPDDIILTCMSWPKDLNQDIELESI